MEPGRPPGRPQQVRTRVAQDTAAKFESLGDNCEFGFVQRRNGVESGGLLRWAIAFPDALIENIANGFRDLYRFENLTPYAPAMVSDAGTGLRFHSQMKSRDGVFLDDAATRAALHEPESVKIQYLRAKLLSSLADARTHFVYKHNHGVSDEQAARLAAAVAERGPASIIVVHQSDDPGKLLKAEQVGANLFYGYLPSFAKYAAAGDFDLSAWMQLLDDACRIMPALDRAGA